MNNPQNKFLHIPRCYIQIKGEKVDDVPFENEREDILYSVAFRNMSAKTQVFNSSTHDHLRTRLTHTLEVARVAVNIAESLGFDTVLTEAIALGHDLGHTPFGHVGERAIHKFSTGEDRKYTSRNGEKLVMPENLMGFKHNLQSIRLLVDYTTGCKFSNYVLYGIMAHSKTQYNNCDEVGRITFYEKYKKYYSVCLNNGDMIPAWSIEAFIVRWADEIAQRHHDIEDAFYQRIMSPQSIVDLLEELGKLSHGKENYNIYERLKGYVKPLDAMNDEERELFPHYITEFVLNTYISNSIIEFNKRIEAFIVDNGIENSRDFSRIYTDINEEDASNYFSMEGTAIGKCDKKINDKLKYYILDSFDVQRMDGRSEYIIRRLLRAYKSNPQQLPNKFINKLIKKEMYRYFNEKQIDIIWDNIEDKLSYNRNNVEELHDYECRDILRTILLDYECEKLILPILMRMVFDYVGSLTDRSAYEEYRELYE